MTTIITVVIAAASVLIGVVAGYFIRQALVKKKIQTAEARAEKVLTDAKDKQKQILLEAKENAIKIIDDSKKEDQDRRQKLDQAERRIEKREDVIDRKYDELDNKVRDLDQKAGKVRNIRRELDEIKKEQIAKLQRIAGLDKEKAKEVLLENVEKDMKDKLMQRMMKLEKVEEDEMDKKAAELLNTAIQRIATSHTAESTATTISLPSDEMKGRIIGREGRNIKALENLTGVEIVVDDTPEAIVISGFNPIRRQVAKLALQKLMKDGRIHPTRIEDAVKEAKEVISQNIKEAGDAVLYDVGVAGVDPKLAKLLGRLKFRTSYGQNVLKHTLEVAHLSAILAEELGADVNVAKKAGLFHDIGKAVDHEVQGTHIEIGRDILKKFGFNENVIHAVEAHHEDVPYKTLEAEIVHVADAISASRPGARRDTYEDYLKRLTDLEQVATGFEGIEKAYAIQAGREIRVFVTPDEIDDFQAKKLAKKIADKIEEELKYPGEIKVNVIREMRVIEYAR